MIVADDRSEDGTGDVARDAANGDSRLRRYRRNRATSWKAGKPWLVSRAAKESKGAWLVFVDRCTIAPQGNPKPSLKQRKKNTQGMLSLFGTWIVEGFREKVLAPLWISIRRAVDLDKVNDISQIEAFANGQCIAIQRSAYFTIGTNCS